MNRLIADRTSILEDMNEVRATFSGAEELEKEKLRLSEQMNRDDEIVKAVIAENALKVQGQHEYNARFEVLSDRAQESKAQYEKLLSEITMRGIRRREFDRFIKKVEELPQAVSDFDKALWSSLVDHLTVYSKDNIVFTLNSGMEIKA